MLYSLSLMISSQPHFSQILKGMILSNFPGLQMAVIIDDGHLLGISVKEICTCGIRKE